MHETLPEFCGWGHMRIQGLLYSWVVGHTAVYLCNNRDIAAPNPTIHMK